MRDFLEDAFKHQDSGFGRAQQHAKRELPKRFYAEAGVAPVAGGFAVTLDGRKTQTPGRAPVTVPTQPLAQVMAAEWAAQGSHIDPMTMPVVRLVNAAVEGGEAALSELRGEVLRYAGNDLLYYRADSPRELIAEQETHWDAALVALARHFDVRFRPTVGVLHQPQPEETLQRLESALDEVALFPAATLVSITGLTGSGLLALGLYAGIFEPDSVWAAAHVDEDYNARLWGSDPEAEQRRASRRIEFDAAVTVLRLST